VISEFIFPSPGLPQVSFVLDEAAQERQFLILQWYQPPPTFAEKNFSTSVVRMHETGPTSRAQNRTLDSERSSECDLQNAKKCVRNSYRRTFAATLDRRPPLAPPKA
jgi:hypothetical protein